MTVAMQQLILAMQQITGSFQHAVYSAHDPDAAVALLAEDATLQSVPVHDGPLSGAELRRHLTEDVLPHLPADLTFRRVSRTTDVRQLVDETVVGFTHDRALPWLLPGAQPTGRHAEVLAVSVVGFRHRTRGATTESHIVSHRTLWDHSTLLARLGLGTKPVVTHSNE